GHDPLGSHPQGHAPGGRHRDIRGTRAGLRPRPRRNHGPGHAHRQLEPDQPLALLARKYPRRPPRPELPRGGSQGSPGPHVCGAGTAGDHPGREPDGRGDYDPLLTSYEGHAMIEASVAVGSSPSVGADARLERSSFEPRALKSLLLTVGVWVTAILAAIPLVSVLYMLIVRGGARLSTSLFFELPPAGFEMGGGFGNAIVGTIVMIGISAVLS